MFAYIKCLHILKNTTHTYEQTSKQSIIQSLDFFHP